jgi:micrococcal nuclease
VRHILLIALFLLGFAAVSQAKTWVRVAHVLDGDTFITESGETVRLIGINTPEKARNDTPAEPFAYEAKNFTTKLINGQEIRLEFEERRTDRYGRLLAHAYLPNGAWINAKILEAGFGHVYSFPDNRGKIRALEPFAANARQERRGIWSLPRWRVLSADETIPDENVGAFNLVQGKVKHTAKVKGITYLNFGEDWRTDFTVEIRPQHHKYFDQADINPLTYYRGKDVIVRGMIKPVNGWIITVSHPEQLTITN